MKNKYQVRLKRQRQVIREDEKIRQAAAKICLDVLGVVPVYVLLEQYGWRNKRLARFIRRYAKVMADVNAHKISVNALADEILQKAKIKYDEGEWYDMIEHSKKAGGAKE